MKKNTAEKTAENTRSTIRLLTSEEVAARLRISLPTLRKIREKGTWHGHVAPPFIMLGAGEREGIRYVESELNDWIMSLPRCTSISHQPVPAKEGA